MREHARQRHNLILYICDYYTNLIPPTGGDCSIGALQFFSISVFAFIIALYGNEKFFRLIAMLWYSALSCNYIRFANVMVNSKLDQPWPLVFSARGERPRFLWSASLLAVANERLDRISAILNTSITLKPQMSQRWPVVRWVHSGSSLLRSWTLHSPYPEL